MRVFVAGGSGVVGRRHRLVPQLVARGHPGDRDDDERGAVGLEQLGAEGVVMDGPMRRRWASPSPRPGRTRS